MGPGRRVPARRIDAQCNGHELLDLDLVRKVRRISSREEIEAGRPCLRATDTQTRHQ
jgi:hypothetical protein